MYKACLWFSKIVFKSKASKEVFWCALWLLWTLVIFADDTSFKWGSKSIKRWI